MRYIKVPPDEKSNKPAVINKTVTRLDANDIGLWRSAGLHVDDAGFVEPSNLPTTFFPMQDDMISNAMVWLAMKLVNFTAATNEQHASLLSPPKPPSTSNPSSTTGKPSPINSTSGTPGYQTAFVPPRRPTPTTPTVHTCPRSGSPGPCARPRCSGTTSRASN